MTSSTEDGHGPTHALEYRQRIISVYPKLLENVLFVKIDGNDSKYLTMKGRMHSQLTEIIMIKLCGILKKKNTLVNCHSLTKSIMPDEKDNKKIKSKNMAVRRCLEALEHFGLIEKRVKISDKNRRNGIPIKTTERFIQIIIALEEEISALHNQHSPIDLEEYIGIKTKKFEIGDK